MKKTLKLIGMCLAAFAMSMNATACINHEDCIRMSTTNKQLKQVSASYGERVTSDFFYYDTEGRIAKALQINHTNKDTLTLLYRYSDDSIIVSYFKKDTAYGKEEYALNNGLITYALFAFGKEGDEGGTSDFRFEYKNNKMVRLTLNDEESTLFTWKDGNLIHLTDEEAKYYFADITYTSNKTTCRWDLWATTFLRYQNLALLMQGYFGDGTKFRATTLTEATSPDTTVTTYTYETDSDGYPIRCSWIEEGSEITYTLVWE